MRNFETRNARKSVKGSNDSCYGLESNKTSSHNIGSTHDVITIIAKHTPMIGYVIDQKPQILKYFFLTSNYNTSRVFKVWIAL